EYGPMPSAPGIQSFPTQCTHALNPLDALVKTLTTASVSIPNIAEASAAAAMPLGTHGRVGVEATSTAFRSVVSTTVGVMVTLLRLRGFQLSHRGAQTEGDHEIEEREPEQHGDRVPEPRALEDLHAVLREQERRADHQGQREERGELLELEEDPVHCRHGLDEVGARALRNRRSVIDVEPVAEADGEEREGRRH